MKFTLKKPCHECPYMGRIPGWIGGHETAQDFVDVVKYDVPFPCHETLDQNSHCGLDAQLEDGKGQQCAGYVLFMNKMCKRSLNADMREMQDRLEEECKEEPIWPPEALVELHDNVQRELRRRRGNF